MICEEFEFPPFKILREMVHGGRHLSQKWGVIGFMFLKSPTSISDDVAVSILIMLGQHRPVTALKVP